MLIQLNLFRRFDSASESFGTSNHSTFCLHNMQQYIELVEFH